MANAQKNIAKHHKKLAENHKKRFSISSFSPRFAVSVWPRSCGPDEAGFWCERPTCSGKCDPQTADSEIVNSFGSQAFREQLGLERPDQRRSAGRVRRFLAAKFQFLSAHKSQNRFESGKANRRIFGRMDLPTSGPKTRKSDSRLDALRRSEVRMIRRLIERAAQWSLINRSVAESSGHRMASCGAPRSRSDLNKANQHCMFKGPQRSDGELHSETHSQSEVLPLQNRLNGQSLRPKVEGNALMDVSN